MPTDPGFGREAHVPLLIVISGPSGAGKDTVVKQMQQRGLEFHFVTTATTRPPRPNEVDGKEMNLTPERSMEIQEQLGADIVMAFDECTPYPATEEQAGQGVQRTIAWAERCQAAHTRTDQALFGIVQGSVYEHLRRRCAEAQRRRSARLALRGDAPIDAAAGSPDSTTNPEIGEAS